MPEDDKQQEIDRLQSEIASQKVKYRNMMHLRDKDMADVAK
jgi:hypothetical protein